MVKVKDLIIGKEYVYTSGINGRRIYKLLEINGDYCKLSKIRCGTLCGQYYIHNFENGDEGYEWLELTDMEKVLYCDW